jgi:hypothetical protein
VLLLLHPAALNWPLAAVAAAVAAVAATAAATFAEGNLGL